MSASLVGSEMCIRDSLSGAAWRAVGRPVLLAAAWRNVRGTLWRCAERPQCAWPRGPRRQPQGLGREARAVWAPAGVACHDPCAR
eukprot:9904450-Alexandrium_andersonii.AAC.1